MKNANKHRKLTDVIITSNTFPHQRKAAQQAFAQFETGSRAVVIAAEMQSGKSGIALALSCLQRLSLSDEAISDRKYLKDTLYLVTMADLALQEQAKQDLAASTNVVVSNFTNFESTLKTHFRRQAPKLIIIDECHYGSSQDSVRYDQVFDYLEYDNKHCNVAFVSATPFSALYAAGADSILRHNFNTSLVFHKTGDDYHGIRQMHRNNQIVKLDENSRDFCDSSLLRNRFIRQFKDHDSAGWSLIRVPSSQAGIARDVLLANGIEPHQIHIIGQKLVGLDEHELCSINDFKREYETAVLFDDKLIAITVASFRAGVNFGQEMKKTLINSWDSTIANIAAIVQANIGRACGYHQNTNAKHYTNLDAVRAYGELLDHLESKHNSHDFEGLHQLFEQIFSRYDVKGFDRGTTIAPTAEKKVTKKIIDTKSYLTKGYLVVPGKLKEPDFDFSVYTTNQELLAAIKLIRQELIGEDGPYRKKNRALRGEHQNWIKAQWVNGATYDDGTQSCIKSKTLNFVSQLDENKKVSFNQIVNPGGGEKTEDKRVMATIFSTYNLSGQMDAFKRSLDSDDISEICGLLNAEHDSDTLIVLYQRGTLSDIIPDDSQDLSHDIETTHIRHHSVF
ncbi:glutathione synthase [Salinivibrio sp. ML323]|uniref:DEAD/DEAH box helicase family protein n=1 Tax=Salinivibrio sp. ML323 TaxID=1909474 RepID=UPI000987347F|nr:DEAD/DEAH box helicase family protein [Salinivibrio sp. ML323]OOE59452.1 glutathione synthase [Salinivibrio sp. ML323]